MSLRRRVVLGSVGWLVAISVLHAWLNLDLFRKPGLQAATTLKVGFLPVT